MEQAMGGTPKLVLAEEGDIFASVSRAPKIPVRETFTPGKVPSIPPLVMPPKLPARGEEGERREPQVPSLPLKIPSVEYIKTPDISIKPLSVPFSSVKPFQASKPGSLEFTAPKPGELPLQPQVPRVEPRATTSPR
jgi:hypothetical protein